MDNYYKMIENKRNVLENALLISNEKYEEENKNGNIQNAELWGKQIEGIEYELENLEAAYTMDAIWHINHATYFEIPNYKEYLNKTVGIEESFVPNKDSYGQHNIEVFRQKLVELSQLKVEIPTLSETINAYHEIENSTIMSVDEKNNALSKYEYLTGISREMAHYSNDIKLTNLQEKSLNAKFNEGFDVFYENGLTKENQK